MDGKHTPGPWRVGEFDKVKTADGETLLLTGVALTSGNHSKTAEAHANARLIAAAPELLAGCEGTLGLLRRAQDILTGYLIPDGYDADKAVALLLELLDGPEQRAIEMPARAAIAKAKGETP